MATFHEKLLAIAREVSFLRGARLVRQGESARGAYLIREGEVEAQVALPGGGSLAVAVLGSRDMFGEMALVERGVCSASVVARTNVDGWFIERDDFRGMVASREPAALELQRELTRALAAKLRAINAKVREHPAAEDRRIASAPDNEAFEKTKPKFAWRSFLPILPFFDGFDAEELDEMVAGSRAFELERGAPLFSQGEAAQECYLVVRGALEVYVSSGQRERRVAIAGPGELVGHLALLDGHPHNASARVREGACVVEFKAPRFLEVYNGSSGASVSLLHSLHRGLLRSLARTNTQLTRLISHARLTAAQTQAKELEQVYYGQVVQMAHPR